MGLPRHAMRLSPACGTCWRTPPVPEPLRVLLARPRDVPRPPCGRAGHRIRSFGPWASGPLRARTGENSVSVPGSARGSIDGGRVFRLLGLANVATKGEGPGPVNSGGIPGLDQRSRILAGFQKFPPIPSRRKVKNVVYRECEGEEQAPEITKSRKEGLFRGEKEEVSQEGQAVTSPSHQATDRGHRS